MLLASLRRLCEGLAESAWLASFSRLHQQDVPLAALFERAWTTYESADAEQVKVNCLSSPGMLGMTAVSCSLSSSCWDSSNAACLLLRAGCHQMASGSRGQGICRGRPILKRRSR